MYFECQTLLLQFKIIHYFYYFIAYKLQFRIYRLCSSCCYCSAAVKLINSFEQQKKRKVRELTQVCIQTSCDILLQTHSNMSDSLSPRMVYEAICFTNRAMVVFARLIPNAFTFNASFHQQRLLLFSLYFIRCVCSSFGTSRPPTLRHSTSQPLLWVQCDSNRLSIFVRDCNLCVDMLD